MTSTNSEDEWETESETDPQDPQVSRPEEIDQGVEHINEVLQENPHLKWGFVIYRCCAYDDQTRWDRFMYRLNKRVRLNLKEQGV